jgi:hypothetical protein
MYFRKILSVVVFVILVIFVVEYDHVFLQKINADFLVDINQSSRVIPHRVNSIGKLQDIWSDGIRSFEVDILYGYTLSDEFQVGHDETSVGDASLEKLFLSVQHGKIEKIWLDLKNMNAGNYLKILLRLEYLNKKLNIKGKVLLESSTTEKFFGKFSLAGWNISYYLPTVTIVNILESESDNTFQLQQIASKISDQSLVQDLSAISFDNRLYPFVKHYLEPLISKEIGYHTWWGPSLKRYSFKSRLLSSEYFLDQRIKTILVKYKSRHHL